MQASRINSVSLLKVFAAYAVVMCHLSPGVGEGHQFIGFLENFAVAYFITISLFFMVRGLSNKNREAGIGCLKLSRLLVPYFSWTVVYVLLRVLKSHLPGEPLREDWIGMTLFGASAVQLYFVPLLLLFKIQLLGYVNLRRQNFGFGFGLLLVAFLIGQLNTLRGDFGLQLSYLRGFFYILSAVLLCWSQLSKTGRQVNVALGFLIILFIFNLSYRIMPLPFVGFEVTPRFLSVLPIFGGYATAALALNFHVRLNHPLFLALLTTSYGIYLSHFLVVEGLEFIFERLGQPLAPYTIAERLGIGLMIYLASAGLVYLLRVHPWTAWYLLGEKAEPAAVPETPLPQPSQARV